MFNEITTFGTTSFFIVVALSIVLNAVYFYSSLPYLEFAKSVNPGLYGKLGVTAQFLVTVIVSFTPYLNILNIVMFCVMAITFTVLHARYKKQMHEFLSMLKA